METASPRTIHFVNLASGFGRLLEPALAELAEQVCQHYPGIPRFQVRPLGACNEETLVRHLADLLPGRSGDHESAASEFTGNRLFVLCDEHHPFVATARQENPRAHWGIAVPCKFAVAWIDNKYLWWHEALHLFNAKDCYNKFGVNKCREPNCVMQASPTWHSCGGRLHLCSKNVRRIYEDLSRNYTD